MVEPKKPILSVESISKSFGARHILQNVSFDIFPGEIFGIIGVSGAGKTTLLELMVGFLKPSKGDIKFRSGELLSTKKRQVFDYSSIFSNSTLIKTMFGFATQNPSFYDDLTIRENLEYFGSLYSIPEHTLKSNIDTALDLVDLKEHQHVVASALSGGMQKRLDIACALIHTPKILILDEPTADLDITLRKQMWHLVKKINQKGTTIIISSHFLDEIESLCNRLAVVHNKTIISKGEVQKLKKLYSDNQEVHLETENKNYKKIVSLLQKQNKLQINKIFVDDNNKLVLHSPDAERLLHYLVHIVEFLKEDVVDVYLNRPTLNEIFETLTKK